MELIRTNEAKNTEMMSAVSQALTSIYTGMFYIDLSEDRYSIVECPNSIVLMLEGIPSAQQAINTAIQNTVAKEEIVDVLTFVNLVTLPDRMASEKYLNIEYKGNLSGWVRGSFIQAGRDGEGKLAKVIYTYQVIDGEKKKELESFQQLKENYDKSKEDNEREKKSLRKDNKELEADLRYHNNLTNVVLDQLTCGVLVYTVPGRKLLQINPEALRIMEMRNVEEAAEKLEKNWGNGIELKGVDKQQLLNLRDHAGSVKYQFIMNAGKENEKKILAESKSFSGRYGGNVVITILMDITHITTLEEEKNVLEDKNVFLANENAELQRARDAVYSSLNSGSYLCTYAEDGETLLSIKFSDALRKLYGYTDEEDAPNTWDMWLKGAHPEDRRYVADSYLAALKDRTGNTNYDVTYRAIKKDGTIHWYRAVGHTIRRADGSAEFCYGYIMDIDEQKKASDMLEKALEEARIANTAKTSFLTRISHDIRTPMNGIIGLIDINDKHADDIAFTTKNRRKAKVAANHLLSLINDVLQLSKLEDSSIELAEIPFNMMSLLDDIITITEMRAKENGIVIKRKDADNIQEYSYLYGSPLHIRQIYINLLGNSIKYNKKNGSISCALSVEKIDLEHISFKMVIEDTGIGMSQEFQKHLFDPFAREHEEVTGKYEGTGLGLAIVKQLIDKMEGTIQVESKVDEGSRFTVKLPFRIASEEEVKKTEEPEDVGNIQGKSILLVEDNELNMDISETVLTDAGANVTKAVNGELAVETFQTSEPGDFDIILMDVMMPVMNGYEATRCIRSLDRTDAQEIPIIALTANAFAEDVEKAKEAGMNDHLAKPLDIQRMLTLIAKYVKS